MLIKSFENYINSRNTVNKLMLEFGAGYSTKIFANNFSSVISYDNNKEYQDKLKRYDNVAYKTLNKDLKPIIQDIKLADYIFVDNDPDCISRYELVKLSFTHSNSQCVLILDNGLWNIDGQKFLQDNYFCKDYYGLRDDQLYTNTIVGEMKIPEDYRR